MTPFKGQHTNEICLARIEQSGIFWLKLALRWWWAATFFLGICVFFATLVIDNLIGIITLWIVAEFAAFLLLILWHLKERAKKQLYITNERIVRLNGKEQFSMGLDEIRDIQIRKNKFTNIGAITFSGVTPLRAKHIPEVQALSKYVHELLRLKKAGATTFPRYRQ